MSNIAIYGDLVDRNTGARLPIGEAVNLPAAVAKASKNLSAYEELKTFEGRGAVYVSGRSAAGDGGDGYFVFSSDDQSVNVTNDPSEGIYVAPSSDTTGASGAWVRQFSGRVHVQWFGVRADGTTDDAVALQACIDACKRFLLPGACNSGVLKIGQQVKLYHPIDFDFSGSSIDCSLITDGVAIRYMPWPDNVYNGLDFPSANISGLFLRGKLDGRVADETFNGTGLYIGNELSEPDGNTSQATFNDLKIDGFKIGLDWGVQTWCVFFYRPLIGRAWDAGIAMRVHENSGENISFFGGTIHDCVNSFGTAHGLYVAPVQGGGTVGQTGFYFHGTSLDYNDHDWLWQSVDGLLLFNGCHFENKSAGYFGRHILTGRSSVEMRDCNFVDFASPARPFYFSVLQDSIGNSRLNGGVLQTYGKNSVIFHRETESTAPALGYSCTVRPTTLTTGGGAFPRHNDFGQIVRNHGFEDGDLRGWVSSGVSNVTTSVVQDSGRHGGRAVRKVFEASSSGFSDIRQSFECTAGEEAAASCYARLSSGAPDGSTLQIQIRFYSEPNAGGGADFCGQWDSA
ncbi:hypothetical protein ACUN8C_05960 [Kushneria sp. Sum13]|uniref:hypothetical protein n=1 Tax=Kushneria sp. Sum13 TaxID=3459196 RepID=UPI0040465953